jgi:hypothetical protein
VKRVLVRLVSVVDAPKLGVDPDMIVVWLESLATNRAV